MGLMTEDRSVLTDEGRSLVDYIFYERLMSLERLSSHSMLLSVQRNLNRLKSRVYEFIANNPYSMFELSVLLKEDNTKEISSAIKVRNFEVYNGTNPRRFLIAIHPSWADCSVYQLSPDGLKIKTKIV